MSEGVSVTRRWRWGGRQFVLEKENEVCSPRKQGGASMDEQEGGHVTERGSRRRERA